jgi:putative hydrolase of the HAD superfamily
MQIDIIAFDADDTLWHTEHLYAGAQARFMEFMAHYHAPEWIEQRLYETEVRNLQHFGYGIKSYILSMIETAVELSEGRVSGRDIQAVIDMGKAMLAAEVQLLPQAAETVERLAMTYPLMLITKGDLFDQESKVARSGLTAFFRHVKVVSDKTPETYRALLTQHGIAPERFVMVGNSLRSDILPVLALGGRAVYVPYKATWAHEVAELPQPLPRGFHQIEHLGELVALVERWTTDDGRRTTDDGRMTFDV